MGLWGKEAGNREAMRRRRRRKANCAPAMALCEINQTKPCPIPLWPTDKGLICAGRSG